MATLQIRSYASRESFRAISILAEFTPTGDYVARTQIVAVTPEAIDLGDISGTPGLLWLRVIGEGAVLLFADSGATKAIGSVSAGLPFVCVPSATLYGQANSGTVTLEVIAFETVTDLTITHNAPTTGTGTYIYAQLAATVGSFTVNTSDEYSTSGTDPLFEHTRWSAEVSTATDLFRTPDETGFGIFTLADPNAAASQIRVSTADSTQWASFGTTSGLLFGTVQRPAIYNGTAPVIFDAYGIGL